MRRPAPQGSTLPVNINTLNYVERFGHTLHSDDSLDEDIREHHEVLTTAGVELTGDYVFIPEGVGFPGSMQVWSKTEHGVWVYVDSLGVMHERENPLLGWPS